MATFSQAARGLAAGVATFAAVAATNIAGAQQSPAEAKDTVVQGVIGNKFTNDCNQTTPDGNVRLCFRDAKIGDPPGLHRLQRGTVHADDGQHGDRYCSVAWEGKGRDAHCVGEELSRAQAWARIGKPAP